MYEKQVAEAHTFAERPIHFDFDRYNLKPQARTILDELGAWLLKNQNFDAIVEGYCDERGTAEYNLALGERRATAAMDYLVKLGVDADRLSAVSYGEENPVDPRSNEEAWAKNRRAEFNVFPTSWYK
ncbi:MAG TPA: peptidoglycan-associated lipoprotein Pal [Deltaproteobacteria bacterium]|nr:peptidoglycan-associated lipoprotein Pal [Deltaproteobacteria bacterium]